MKEPTIILDNGSSYLKAGLSNEEIPSVNIPVILGRPLNVTEKVDFRIKPLMIGDEVPPFSSFLELSHPMIEGIIINEDDMTTLYDYCIREKLGITDDLKERKLLLTESDLNTNNNKKKMGEIFFEKFGISYFNIEPRAKLALFSQGIQTGMVLHSGGSETYCVPIVHDYLLHHHIKKLDIAGRHISQYLTDLLKNNGYNFHFDVDFELMREIKDNYCFVSSHILSERKLNQETTYHNSILRLPDGRKITLSSEKYEATEILFHPELIHNDKPGVHEMIVNSIIVINYFIIFCIINIGM